MAIVAFSFAYLKSVKNVETFASVVRIHRMFTGNLFDTLPFQLMPAPATKIFACPEKTYFLNRNISKLNISKHVDEKQEACK